MTSEKSMAWVDSVIERLEEVLLELEQHRSTQEEPSDTPER